MDKNAELKDVLSSKHYWTIKELCYGLPIEILLLMKYIKFLEENSKPNYKKIGKYLSTSIKSSDIDYYSENEDDNLKQKRIEPKSNKFDNSIKTISVSYNSK